MRVGVIRNPASHGHRRGPADPVPSGVQVREPSTAGALAEALADFARAGVGLIVVDGGDGTIREVVSGLPSAFGQAEPLLTVRASGKTNLLARDLSPAAHRPPPLAGFVSAALRAADTGRRSARRPLEIVWRGGEHPAVRGFFFGAAAFRRATAMAQGVHRVGAFQGAAVGLTLAGATLRVLAGSKDEPWRRGERITLAVDDGAERSTDRFLVLASTLGRLPLKLKPLGSGAGALRYIDVDAPPRRLPAALPRVLAGRGDRWLAERGYRRGGAERLRLSLGAAFILDGETFPQGEITIEAGAPLRFVVP